MIQIQNEGIVGQILLAPLNTAFKHTLPKLIDPNTSFEVRLLANIGSRLLFIVQSVVAAVSLPFLLIYNILAIWLNVENAILTATKTVILSSLIAGGILIGIAMPLTPLELNLVQMAQLRNQLALLGQLLPRRHEPPLAAQVDAQVMQLMMNEAPLPRPYL